MKKIYLYIRVLFTADCISTTNYIHNLKKLLQFSFTNHQLIDDDRCNFVHSFDGKMQLCFFHRQSVTNMEKNRLINIKTFFFFIFLIRKKNRLIAV